MIKCEVIEKFNLKEFAKLKNIQREAKDVEGKLFVGDTFECDEKMADYLTGNNKIGRAFVKVIEVHEEKPKEEKKEVVKEELKTEKKTATKKTSKKK